jgi:hypothetical protein
MVSTDVDEEAAFLASKETRQENVFALLGVVNKAVSSPFQQTPEGSD